MKKKDKVEIVYEYLLSEMASQHYRSGDHLLIGRIAKACSTSETPVREALRRLESNGYVKITPNQGAVAVGLDMRTIADIVQIKGVLEGFATRLSIDYLSSKDLMDLHLINVKLQKASEASDFAAISQLNMEFHMSIYRHLPQKEIVSFISDLWTKWSVTKNIFSVAPGIMNKSYEEHEHILKLLKDRCYAEVEQFVREHKFKAMNSWLSGEIQTDLWQEGQQTDDITLDQAYRFTAQ